MPTDTAIVEPSAKLRAYSYLRFSTPEQEKGDSYRRQVELAAEYAAKKGWELDDTLHLYDKGKSAFRSQNAETGALGGFLNEVRAGSVPPGSVLLVESLDRLSRDKVMTAVARFIDLMEAGVKVVTLADSREYSTKIINNNPTELIVSILVMMRAHEESETKSKRLKASWRAKRDAAEERKLTKRCPAWLQLSEDRESFNVIERRAAVIRRIFDMARAGQGQHAIAKTLQAEGIPTWGDHGSKRQRAAFWQRSYVKKILCNPAVIGTYVPHVIDYDNPEKKKQRRPLKAVEGYYPAVVDRETFEHVQDILLGKTSQPRGRHARAPTQNVLASLGRCPKCGGTMTRVTKGPKSKAGQPYLVCSKAKTGADCDYQTVRMSDVEDALLGFSAHLLGEARRPGLHPELERLRDDLREQHGETTLKIENLLEEIRARRGTRAISEDLRALEAMRDRIELQLADVMRKMDRAGGHNLDRRLHELIVALSSLAEHRLGKAKQVLAVDGRISRRKGKRPAKQIVFPAEYEKRSEARVVRTAEGKGQDIEAIGRANKALKDLLSRVVVDYETGKLLLHWHHMPEPSAVPLHSGSRSVVKSPSGRSRSVVVTRSPETSGADIDALELTFLGGDKP